MRRSALALLLILLPVARAGDVAPGKEGEKEAIEKAWLLRTSRMEGASVGVTEAAAALKEAGNRVAGSGRLQALSELRGLGNQLNRQVASAKLAAEVLDQP